MRFETANQRREPGKYKDRTILKVHSRAVVDQAN